MKKLLVLIICATGLVLLEAGPVQPATLEVRPPGGMGALGGGTVYTSIQQAIDAADPFDIIEVAAGVYDGNIVGPEGHLVIETPNLTLKSEEGKDSTTIKVANGVGIDIRAGAANFVLGGEAGHGFTIAGKSDTTFVIQLTSAPSGVEISHNAIDTTGNASMGISVGAAGAADLTISNNDFTAESGDGCIWGPRLVDLAVSDNTFDGGSYAIQTSGITSSSPSVISGNVITGFTGSGAIVICNGEKTSDLAITGNTITECTNGIRFAQYCAQGAPGDMTTVTVEDNTLSTNTNGILVGDGENILASNFTIQNNCITGNTYGLKNEHASELVTAEENAWGDANGPYHPVTNPYASGDEVSDNVEYYPWYPDCNFTTVVYKPVHNVTLNAYYYTIQAAIDEASPDDVIEADAGTFTEDVTIDKSLTLNGAQVGVDARSRSASESEIVGVVEVTSAATDVVFDGFKFTSPTRAFTPRGFNLHVESENSTIKNCIFVAEENAGHTYSGYLDFGGITNTTVERNSFSGDLDPTQTPNVIMLGITGAGTVTVTHNEMHNVGGGGGIGVMCSNSGAVINIIDNEIENTGDGIWFWDPTSGSFEVNIQSNTIYNCQKKGVKIISPVGITAVNCNRIYDNTEEGVYNSVSSLLVDATFNWWGDASGPSGVGGGSGDAVSENVDFFPWLLSTDCNDYAPEMLPDFVVDDDWAGYHDYTMVTVDGETYYIGFNAFAVIQDAVIEASDGNSIRVADGNYVETLVIDKSVKVIGAGGETSIVQSSTGLKLISINAAGTEVELAGFTLRHTGTDNWGSSYVMLIENGAYAYIHDNVVDDFKKRGIYVMGSGSSADITANTITGEGEGSGLQNGIVVWNSGGGFANIVNNEVSGGYYTGERWTATGIMALDTYDKAVLIAGNYVHDNQIGIAAGNYCEYTPGSYSADVTIRANRVEYNTYGIDIFNDIRGALIQGNYVSASTEYAIGVSDYNDTMAPCEQPTDTIIQFNNIADNNLGMWVIDRVGPVDAQYNWWGDISGPNDPCGTSETDGITCYDVSTMKNVDGLGDEVTENVDYCPWLTAAISRSDDPLSLGDLNGDGCVNFYDVAILADEWLEGCE